MQVVGKNCEDCGAEIRIALDVRACEACGKVFHSACLEDPRKCPICNKEFADMENREIAVEYKQCPKCGAISPPSALTCECGQDLLSGKYLQIKSESKKESGMWIITGFGIVLLGLFLSSMTYYATGGGGAVLFYGLVVAGLGVAANGYRKYRRLN